MAERVPLPRLLSRSASTWLSVAAAVVGVLAVVGFLAATDEANRPFAIGLGVLVLLALVVLLLRRRWVEPDTGVLVVEVGRVWRRRWRLAEATSVRVVPNGVGQVVLQVADPARRTPLTVELLADDLGGARVQPAAVHRLLADQVERWTGRHERLVELLRAQAAHQDAGGQVADAPLRATGRRPPA